MIVNKGFKFRLQPTKEQKQQLLQHGGNCRFLWNKLLGANIERYENEKKFNFGHVMVTSLPGLKQEHEFLQISVAQSLQTIGRNLDKALKNFLKKRKTDKSVGFPTFKCKNLEKDSFHCPQKWGIHKKHVQIPKIGKVPWIKHRKLQGKPKSITITQDGKHWYCSVLCEVEIQEKQKKTDNIVGIDVGAKTFAVLSDGTKVKRQRFTKEYEKKLKIEQQKLDNKKKGSNNRKKQRRKVQKIHRKIRNSRRDFLHKTTCRMITKYDGFCVETLNIQEMAENNSKAESRSNQDASWHEFLRILEYKSLWNFKWFVKTPEFFPSSQLCNKCKNRKSMPKEIRTYECEKCGNVEDRDFNASLNIKEEGMKLIASTSGREGMDACLGSKESKQEKELYVV